MAIIKCPECGKEVSDRAPSCIFCGCPIGASANGTLRVQLNSFLKLIGNMHIIVSFNGESFRINRGYYHDFVVPADGQVHTGEIRCYHGLFDGAVFKISLNSGESKKIFINFNDGRFGSNKWEYREQFFIIR